MMYVHPPGIAEQPDPVAHPDEPSVHELVLIDVRCRADVGLDTYGQPLTARNGRDALTDAYQEALDLACYLRQAIRERDGR